MAKGSKRQRKKIAKRLGTWEGNQYRGGRGKGKKNLKKVPGGVQNKHGVTFTLEQKKALERAVDRSNYRRKKMLEYEMEVNQDNEEYFSELRTMGKESVYSIARQSKSLQRFKSMEEYEQYMDKQARIQSGEYQLERIRAYKRNFIDSLLETYGPEAKDIAMKVRMMKPEEYMAKVAGDEVLEISFVPSDRKVTGRLNQLRAHLGMKLKPDWPDEYEE